MTARINWDSIGLKFSEAVAKRISKQIERELLVMANDFQFDMDVAISNAPGLTVAESERVSFVPFEHTGTTKIMHKSPNGLVIGKYKLFFDFVGDKTMVSLSPYKRVHDLVALFNNGYVSNNVDANHPIRGMWHGMEISIGPRSKRGAHFIGTAINKFKQDYAALYPKYNISFNVNPNYHIST